MVGAQSGCWVNVFEKGERCFVDYDGIVVCAGPLVDCLVELGCCCKCSEIPFFLAPPSKRGNVLVLSKFGYETKCIVVNKELLTMDYRPGKHPLHTVRLLRLGLAVSRY